MGAGRTDETVIILAPDEGAEIKLVMEQGAKVRYVWAGSGGRVNFDVHADRPVTPYHAYGKGSSKREEGELAPIPRSNASCEPARRPPHRWPATSRQWAYPG